ncbi:MAG: SAM-dependent methyltransferase [Nitrospiraceae bacterium]
MRGAAIRSFEDFRDAVSAYRLPRILLTALDLDLFTVIGSRTWPVPTLARRLRVSSRGLDILCRNLASTGVLVKSADRYGNGTVGRTYLNAKSPLYRGAYLDLLRGHWEDWSQLTKSVKRGSPIDHDEPDEPKYRRAFSWAMHQRSLQVAPRVAAQLDLRGVRTLLDLGGGPGTYALAFLARNPKLRATVCDRPPALEVAREIAGRYSYGRRLSYLPCDFMKQPIRGRFDVIWLSNVVHIFSPSENQRLFGKLAAALTPGGRLLVQDAFLHDRNGLYPEEATLFAVTMLLFTERGNTYSARDVSLWLKKAGFGRTRPLILREGTEDWTGGILEALSPAPHRGTRTRLS